MERLKRNITRFNGQQYSVWKFRILSLLAELDVAKVLQERDSAESNKKWQKAERIAKGTIIEYLADSFLSFVHSESTAKDIIEKLDSLYERKSVSTKIAIKDKLSALKMKNDISLELHFNDFDNLVREAIACGVTVDESDKISYLLRTLPIEYNTPVFAMQTVMPDDASVEFVKQRLFDIELKIKEQKLETSAKVLSAETKENEPQEIEPKTNDSRNYNSRCYNSRNSHFRPRYQNNKWQLNRSKKFVVKCYHCGKQGHKRNVCRDLKLKNKNQKHTKKNSSEKKSFQMINVESPSQPDSGFMFMMSAQGCERDSSNNSDVSFILDSGASDHAINNDDLFSSFENLPAPMKIYIAKNGAYINATKRGQIKIVTDQEVEGWLNNVLYCPDLPYNLLSVRRLQEANMTVIFDKSGVEIKHKGKTIIKGKLKNNLFGINFKIKFNTMFYSATNNNYDLWHRRLGHISKNKFLELKNNKMFVDISKLENVSPHDNLCEPCISGKQARLHFDKVKDKSHISRPLFVVHTDVCGPISPPTFDDKNYFVIFVDQFTHYCVTYLIKNKSDVFSCFKDYVMKSEAHFNVKLVRLYCDNGREYLSNDMKEYCVEKGVTYHLTVPRTPQQNGVSERMNRTITEKARSMIADARLSKIFWGEAVLTATFLINRTPTKAIKNNKTPFELWHNKRPQLKYLRVFGSTVYVHDKTRQSKFDRKSWKGIMLGYEPNGYRVWDVESDKIHVVRDVIFDEKNYSESRPVTIGPDEHPKRVDATNNNELRLPRIPECTNSDDCVSTDWPSVRSKPDHKRSDETLCESVDLGQVEGQQPCVPVENTEVTHVSKPTKRVLSPEVRRSQRIRARPEVSYKETDLVLDDCILTAQSVVCDVPKCFSDIKQRDDKKLWQDAIKDEINSLNSNKTWTLVDRPGDKNIVNCKWVFTIKNDECGNPAKYKARLVACGYSQQYLIDYEDTFAPVARIASLRFILAFANQFDLLVHHMDVKTAFLNGSLKEEIYMKVPEGIINKNNQVCKLNKALYGLKQAARCWFETFEETLKKKGFKNSAVDRCIYILDRGHISKNIYVLLYVDDLVVVTADPETMRNFKLYLMNQFKMVDLKEIKLFLGIKITRNENEIAMDQSTYIKAILAKFNMSDCNSVQTPLETNINYHNLNDDKMFNAPCRNLIGCLMYVMLCTRPDLSTAVIILSRYLTKNNAELWQCLKRVLRYLKGTINLRLTYKRCAFNDFLCGYVDSDWGRDEFDRKSTTGYVFKVFEQCVISWNTKKQTTVAASSTEAEYMALHEAVREALWLKSLASSINIHIVNPIILYEDNNGCISIANNFTSHKRSKHIDIKYHFSREQVENKTIKLIYVSTGNQLADVMTKPLAAPKFLEFRAKLNLK